MNETAQKLVADLKSYNEAYRAGNPLISDAEYDELVERLREMDPENPYLQAVEPEDLAGKAKVRHPQPMLSTEKAYTMDALSRWVARVEKEAAGIGVQELTFRVTPKLDGVSGRNENGEFATRGDGRFGQDIRSAWDKGIVPVGGKGLGLGEIVVVKSYFADHLSEEFTHPRNMVVGILGADVLNEHAQKALADKVVRFVPYSTLDAWEGPAETMLENFDQICADIVERTDYPLDGFVVEVTDPDVKARMGATSHHYRWQIAFKHKTETEITTVNQITWQVGRLGAVTPVLEIEPTLLSGATIRRVTAHHAGMVRSREIGPGAQIKIIRSGEVIPKIEDVIQPSDQVELPRQCPVCGTDLIWENDFLRCTNRDCRAQVEQRISHWFKTLGNADWFGPKAIERMVAGGFDTLEKIYAMTESDFLALEFGPGQARNLADALQISRTNQIEDWRFLAAFGVPSLGRGDARNLLGHVRLEEIPQLTADRIEQIHGFGAVTSKIIADGVAALNGTLQHVLDLGFNLERTPLQSDLADLKSPISGKGIVFTGRMLTGNREEMQSHARTLGAKVQTSVSGKTDFLVCGENVGAKKIEKATKLGVTVMNEVDYFKLIGEK